MTSPVDWNVTFGEINEGNVHQLRKINTSIFPVRYQDRFYTDLLTTNPDFTQFAYSNGCVVGAICCRVENEGGSSRNLKLYIMTLGVLATWRRRGIGSKLLLRALDNLSHYKEMKEIYLHVQTSNQDAVDFYKSHGFCVEEKIENYYNRIEPPDCYVLRRHL
ncbi:unnamed protein product [Discosporangium mesarthrocarpum]